MLSAGVKLGLMAAGASALAVGSQASPAIAWVDAQVAPFVPGMMQPAVSPADASLASAVAQWKAIRDTSTLGFSTYASFLMAHPGWPGEMAMRRAAEGSLVTQAANPTDVAAFFRRFPPLTSAGQVRFALALQSIGAHDEAVVAAKKAWTSGVLAVTDESTLLATFSSYFFPTDHDKRMDMLLWQGSTSAAMRVLPYTSTARRTVFAARLALRTNAPDAASQEAPAENLAAGDPGFLADRAIWLRANGAAGTARSLLAQPHVFATPPADPAAWMTLLLTNAQDAQAVGEVSNAFAIARQVDDVYPAGTDISLKSYKERDEYTDLTWLAGQLAMKQLGRPADAVTLFDRYGAGSATPSTQSKGLYWAGRAAELARQPDQAHAYLERAANFRDQFYGQLAAERLSVPLTAPADMSGRTVDPADRTAFYRRETVRAAQYLGTVGQYADQTAFIRQIALDATTESDHILSSELSRTIGRPDLGVMIGRSAVKNGYPDYSTTSFPMVRVPTTAQDSWTIIHAIARQESQFDRMAVSRTGARGLMQLMPGTARETAYHLGLSVDSGSLADSDFSIMIGAAYFKKLYTQYGSYPLAIAAYNAGGGNVNKWLAANGDPRNGTVPWVDWIEAIPFHETRNYVQRVLENAVVYDLLNPQHATSRGPANLSWYIGNKRPG